jgi:hypothetical protein
MTVTRFFLGLAMMPYAIDKLLVYQFKARHGSMLCLSARRTAILLFGPRMGTHPACKYSWDCSN